VPPLGMIAQIDIGAAELSITMIIELDTCLTGTEEAKLTFVEYCDFFTQVEYRRHIVADKYHGPPGATDLVHLAEALLLKRLVAHSQHLVHNQNLRLQMRGDRKSQPYEHAAGISLDGGVQKLAYFRKWTRLVERERWAVEQDLVDLLDDSRIESRRKNFRAFQARNMK